MGRYSQSPNLYDEVNTVSIQNLKKWGYLEPLQFKSGKISWKNGFGDTTGSIGIAVNTRHNNPYIELSYTYRGENVRYNVDLISIPSNLGCGKIWYFLCPYTKKRCRKLYSTGKYFLHREATKGLYRIQTLSGKNRDMANHLQIVFQGEESYSNIFEKHYKKSYAGKPTRRFLRDWKRIRKAGLITANEFNSIYR